MKFYSNNQTGSVALVLTIILTVLILGGLGYVAYSKASNQNTGTAVTSQQTKVPQQLQDIEYQPVIKISASSNPEQLTDIPATFRAYVSENIASDNAELKKSDPNCERVYFIERIYEQKYILGGQANAETCGVLGSMQHIWILSNSKWIALNINEPVGYNCDELKQYNVPAEIVKGTCYSGDPLTAEGQAYTQGN